MEHHNEGALSTTYCNLLKACLGAVLHKSIFYSLFNTKKAILVGWWDPECHTPVIWKEEYHGCQRPSLGRGSKTPALINPPSMFKDSAAVGRIN